MRNHILPSVLVLSVLFGAFANIVGVDASSSTAPITAANSKSGRRRLMMAETDAMHALAVTHEMRVHTAAQCAQEEGGSLLDTLSQRARVSTREVIYLLGDSTMRQQFIELCDTLSVLPGYALREIELPKTVHPIKHERTLHIASVTIDGMHLLAAFQGKRLSAWFDIERGAASFSFAAWRAFLPKPTLVYVTGGLHLLHLGLEKSIYWNQKSSRTLLAAEKILQEFLDMTVVETGAAVVVSLLPAICDNKWTNDRGGRNGARNFGDAVTLLKGNPEAACAEFIQAYTLLYPLAMIRKDEIIAMCLNSALTRRGAHHLNERLLNAVDAWVAKNPASSNQVRVLNLFKLTESECANAPEGDAMHFPELRTRRFVTLMNCFYDIMKVAPPQVDSAIAEIADVRSMLRTLVIN